MKDEPLTRLDAAPVDIVQRFRHNWHCTCPRCQFVDKLVDALRGDECVCRDPQCGHVASLHARGPCLICRRECWC